MLLLQRGQLGNWMHCPYFPCSHGTKCTEFPAPVAETALSVLTFQGQANCDFGEMCRTYASPKASKWCNVTPKVTLWKFQKATIDRGRDHWAGVLLGYSVKSQIIWLQSHVVSHLQANACFSFGFKFTSVITLPTWIDFDLLLLCFPNLIFRRSFSVIPSPFSGQFLVLWWFIGILKGPNWFPIGNFFWL